MNIQAAAVLIQTKIVKIAAPALSLVVMVDVATDEPSELSTAEPVSLEAFVVDLPPVVVVNGAISAVRSEVPMTDMADIYRNTQSTSASKSNLGRFLPADQLPQSHPMWLYTIFSHTFYHLFHQRIDLQHL